MFLAPFYGVCIAQLICLGEIVLMLMVSKKETPFDCRVT